MSAAVLVLQTVSKGGKIQSNGHFMETSSNTVKFHFQKKTEVNRFLKKKLLFTLIQLKIQKIQNFDDTVK